jgi:hypothetical protein
MSNNELGFWLYVIAVSIPAFGTLIASYRKFH